MAGKQWRFETQVIHGALAPEQWKSATLAPIYQTAAHRFDTAEELSAVFAGKKAGFIYQRLRNPTNEALEKRMALLEGGRDAVVTGSGMAAINDAILAVCRAGDEIVSGNSLFMSTFLLFNNVLRKLGIDVKLVESGDLAAWKAAVTPKPNSCSSKPSGTPRWTCPTSRRSRRWPARTAPRSSSTTPWPRLTCCGRSSTGPTSSCTRPRSTSTGMGRPSEAW
jgi:O-acetylhomoserine (thiol)-lyase